MAEPDRTSGASSGPPIDTLLSALPVAAIVLDARRHVRSCNAAAERLLTVTAARVVGRPFARLGGPLRLSAVARAIADAIDSGTARNVEGSGWNEGFCVTVTPIDAEETLVLVLPEQTATSEVATERNALAAELDVLERRHRETEQRLIDANENLQSANAELAATNEELHHRLGELAEAERVDQRKNEFLAMLAHELRNPLAPIRSALHVIRVRDERARAPLDPVVVEARRMAERQVAHLARLVDDLLDVSRITRNKIQLLCRPVDLAGAATEALDTHRERVEQAGQRTRMSFPPEPIVVEADPMRLVQMIGNLVGNASKYTGPGGEIAVTGTVEEGAAVLRVRDTGVGIAPDVLPRVFDLFVQAESSLARSRGGLGIGLTLVRHLAELQGGTVTAASAGLGKGSEFTLRLPLGHAVPEEDSGRPSTAAAQRRRRVLLVEDNRDSREMLRTALELEGHQVDTAADGAEGVEKAVTTAPDAAFVDLGLPGVDGYEVARRIRQRLGNRPLLVALTGYGDAEARQRTREAGFDFHLVKPVDPGTLITVLARRAEAAG